MNTKSETLNIDMSSGAVEVSVIVPCRNECELIEECLKSIISNDFSKDRLEVLVIDGMSEDGSVEIIERYARLYPFIRLIQEPKKIIPSVINTGVLNAKGEVIVRVDAHAQLEENYISECVHALDAFGADAVGGIMQTVPRRRGALARAIAICLSHPFGVGTSHFRVGKSEPFWVDTVYGPCYRRDRLLDIGLFNERLTRSSDIEFHRRLKKAGGRILLIPNTRIYYYAHTTMRTFLKRTWIDGMWAIIPMLYSNIMPISWRHLVPGVFVLSILLTAVLVYLQIVEWWILVISLGSYLFANLVATISASIRERSAKTIFALPVAFAGFHVAYGLGSLTGIGICVFHLVRRGLDSQFAKKNGATGFF